MVKFGRKLELINIQQPGKKEIHNLLSQEALNTVLKATYLAKKSGKKTITQQELKTALKQ